MGNKTLGVILMDKYTMGICLLCKQTKPLKNGICINCNDSETCFKDMFGKNANNLFEWLDKKKSK